MSIKKASPEHPIHDLLAARWSPYAFDERPVADAELRTLFEAARWAPSSYNEQPWSYIVAKKENPAAFQPLLSCLVETNRIWAKDAPVLALGIVRTRFLRNGNFNRSAAHVTVHRETNKLEDSPACKRSPVPEMQGRGLSAIHMVCGTGR